MNTCGRLDEHAKERKSFTKQAYAPGLKGPGPLGRIDFGNPALKPMLRMMADNMKKDTRAYHPPEGLRLRSLSVDNGNGRQIWCFVMEPEGEETRSLPGMLYCHGGCLLYTSKTGGIGVALSLIQRRPFPRQVQSTSFPI